MNAGNTALGLLCGETFTVVGSASGGKGTPGDYQAVSIDDLGANTAVIPGGLRGENDVNVWIDSGVLTTSLLAEGDKLIVRGKRVRILRISDDGDNTFLLACGTPGMK